MAVLTGVSALLAAAVEGAMWITARALALKPEAERLIALLEPLATGRQGIPGNAREAGVTK